jgi:hypothetical protein
MSCLGEGVIGTSMWGEVVEKSGRRMNMVQKYIFLHVFTSCIFTYTCIFIYTRIYVNAQIMHVGTLPGIGGEGIKREMEGMNSSVIFDTL